MPLWGDASEPGVSLSTVRGHSEKAADREPGRGASSERGHAAALSP